jgi:hypothetical protein
MPTLNPVEILLGALSGAVTRMVGRPDVPLTAALAPTITRALEQELAADPALRHVANAEPWYASRVTWGAILAALSPILGLVFGHTLTSEDQASFAEIAVALGTLTGAGLALYGRWRARAPLRLK